MQAFKAECGAEFVADDETSEANAETAEAETSEANAEIAETKAGFVADGETSEANAGIADAETAESSAKSPARRLQKPTRCDAPAVGRPQQMTSSTPSFAVAWNK